MAKCTECHSCMRRYIYYGNTRYLVCPVCLEVFVATPTSITRVTDTLVRKEVIKKSGFTKGKIE